MSKTSRRAGKREAILEIMRGTTEHPSAEWVYEKLKPAIPDLSLGTVYRNIARFMEAGDIVRVANVNGKERYDANVSIHAHFICAGCGDIRDVTVPLCDSLVQMAEKETGACISETRLSFGGLCSKCGSIN